MDVHPAHNSRRFDPAKVERLLAPDRANWLRPDLILAALSLEPGLTLLDFGAGPGYFSLPIAQQLGPGGRVIAADVEPALLHLLMDRAAQASVTGIYPIACQDSDLPFRGSVFDRVLLSLVLHEVGEPQRLLHEAARVLTPGGRAFLVEWHPGQTDHGPPAEHRLVPAQITRSLSAAGLVPDEPVSLSPDCYIRSAAKPKGSHKPS
jgi:ubiquinone/menaquinone biosynthesis C-methylase UbiE